MHKLSKKHKLKKTYIYNIKKTSKITSLNEKHNNKEVNATSLIKHSKPLFYVCKHKYRTKMNKKQLKQATRACFQIRRISRTTTLSLFFFWKILPLPNLLSFPSLGRTFFLGFQTLFSYANKLIFFFFPIPVSSPLFFNPFPFDFKGGIYRVFGGFLIHFDLLILKEGF